MVNFKLKTSGKINKWNALTGEFVLGTPLGDIGITTDSITLIDELIEAMKNRGKVSLIVGEVEE